MEVYKDFSRPATLQDVVTHYLDANSRAGKALKIGEVALILSSISTLMNITLAIIFFIKLA